MDISSNTFVLSLGGSLVAPNEGIDNQFLIDFNKFIRNQISAKKRRFFIVVGGGSTTRQYQKAASQVRSDIISDVDLDWLGIHATRLNAQLVRTIFQDIADPRVIKHYEIILKIDKPVAIAAGWKPGRSSDFGAITLCQDYNIKTAINMTNIDRVYTKDPKKFPEATPIDRISWKNYLEIIPQKWTPGMNVPFDPIASKLAQKEGITVKILNGARLDNLGKALDNKKFLGSTIY